MLKQKKEIFYESVNLKEVVHNKSHYERAFTNYLLTEFQGPYKKYEARPFLQPELATAVHGKEGLIFPSMDKVTRLLSSLSDGITIFKSFVVNGSHEF